jgi:hypothetical protein
MATKDLGVQIPQRPLTSDIKRVRELTFRRQAPKGWR